MAPEYGATMGFFPVDDETLDYLRFTGRDREQVELVEAYCKEQGLFRTAATPEPLFSDTLELDLGDGRAVARRARSARRIACRCSKVEGGRRRRRSTRCCEKGPDHEARQQAHASTVRRRATSSTSSGTARW